jgi:hypothetical protein
MKILKPLFLMHDLASGVAVMLVCIIFVLLSALVTEFVQASFVSLSKTV